ncbi:MAG: peptidoglycan editing factor PgeF [Bacteroidetes bacterium]|jgi:YfiH family protein|nr:peptidoglycan editing factor PgeF [Bacteroidota bacterium]
MAAAVSLLYPDLLHEAAPGLVAAFTPRTGGVSEGPFASLNLSVSTGDTEARVEENRRRALAPLGFTPEAMAIAGQVHGTRVQTARTSGFYAATDGLVTDRPGVLLSFTAADCAVVLLADPVTGVVGGCHAGWRGAAAGIVAETVEQLAALGAQPSRCWAYISPCISVDHFEVGEEVAAQFDAAHVHRPLGAPRPFVDLKGALQHQLTEAGLVADTIEVDPQCTFAATDTFFSHRAEHGDTGRMMAFIGMHTA